MKRLKKFLFLLLLLPICVNAQVAMNDSSVEEVDGSNVVAGNNVTSTNKVNGINIVFGNNVNLNGENPPAGAFSPALPECSWSFPPGNIFVGRFPGPQQRP